ncbi:MAG: ATP-binding protein [Kiloniellales bacterium]|nr:ATP-binding protein [Kiloniellales bacterium]
MICWRTPLVSGLYFLGALVGIALAREAGNVAAIWPPNAILLALLLVRPPFEWPRYLVGCFLANLGANLLHGDQIAVAAGFGLVNMLEVLVAAKLIAHYGSLPFRLQGLRPLLLFCLHAAILACGLGATAGAALVWAAYGAAYTSIWPIWFVADAVGVLLITPLALSLLAVKPRTLRDPVALLVGLSVATLSAIGSVLIFSQEDVRYVFLVMPALLLVALRFKLLGTAAVAGIVATVAVGFTVLGAGPFATSASASSNILGLQVFLLGELFPLLALAGLLQEQDEIKQRLLERQKILDEGARIAQLGYWTWDVEADRCKMVSDEMMALLCLDREKFAAHAGSLDRYLELLHADDREDYRRTILQSRTEGSTYQIDFRLAECCGVERHVCEVGGYLRDRNGRVTTALGVMQEVTERKAQEEILRQAKLKAEEADLAKDRFLATVSHEIRTPINGVLGMIELLLGSGLDNNQRQFADTARESSKILLTIIDDLLDLSKMEAGRLTLESLPFHLPDTVGHVIEIMAPKAKGKGVTLRAELDDGMPAWLSGDPYRLTQILFNLVGNAIKFTFEGEIVVRAVAEPLAEKRYRIRFEVADSGIGIPTSAQQEIFDHFAQADVATTRIHGGTGLGLAICRQLTELMGGEIGVVSSPDRGSTFWFTIVCPAARAPESESAGAPTSPARPDAQKLRVLVAEDNSINQMLVRVLLELDGHEVAMVADGASAVEALASERFDVVLMDDDMPEMCGIEAVRRIRALKGPSARVPVIAVTAHAMEADRKRYLEAGMDDHIAKPIDKEYLLQAIRRATGRTPRSMAS